MMDFPDWPLPAALITYVLIHCIWQSRKNIIRYFTSKIEWRL